MMIIMIARIYHNNYFNGYNNLQYKYIVIQDVYGLMITFLQRQTIDLHLKVIKWSYPLSLSLTTLILYHLNMII